MNTNHSFLCSSCRRGMCQDCKEIADEYAELLQLRTIALHNANDQAETLERENAMLKKEIERWREMAKLGLPEVMRRWTDDQIKAV